MLFNHHGAGVKVRSFEEEKFLADDMAGMSLDNQPDEEATGQVEGTHCPRRYVDQKSCACFYAEGDHGAPDFHGFDGAGKDVAGAEEMRGFGGDEDVSGADGYADFRAGGGVAEGNFDFAGGVIERDTHDAVGGAVFDDNRGENVFETGGVG